MSHDESYFYPSIDKLLKRLKTEQSVQERAQSSGVNTGVIKLSDDVINDTLTTVLSLALAKDNDDPAYHKLTAYGLQKRETKVKIVDKYKDEANAIIQKYYNQNK